MPPLVLYQPRSPSDVQNRSVDSDVVYIGEESEKEEDVSQIDQPIQSAAPVPAVQPVRPAKQVKKPEDYQLVFPK